MIGDWNFVREARDRIHFDSGAWNGGEDEQEHDDFAEAFFTPHGMFEARQPEPTMV